MPRGIEVAAVEGQEGVRVTGKVNGEQAHRGRETGVWSIRQTYHIGEISKAVEVGVLTGGQCASGGSHRARERDVCRAAVEVKPKEMIPEKNISYGR